MSISESESAVLPSPELLRQVRRLEIRARRLVAERLMGQYHSVFRGRGLEFSEVREYQPGDDVRTIDWNVTARMGAPYVKRFVEERELTVMLAVDVSASQRFGTAAQRKEEVAAELGALLAFAAAANNDRVGLLAFSDGIEAFVPPRKGSRHILRLVRDLLSLRPARRGTDIGAAVGYLQRALRRHAIVFLISDFLDDGFEAALRSAARRHDLIALVLSDRRELELPAVGLIEAEDAETGERVWLDAGDAAVRERFALQAAGAHEARRRTLASLGIDVVEISTDGSYVEPLLSYFQARARRR
jgi:uncharacterized protein (DUF58 family)